tara:strand:- start:3276 stop:5222 length:1947 start_codon:yes stop_codon:yes gene_type:complete
MIPFQIYLNGAAIDEDLFNWQDITIQADYTNTQGGVYPTPAVSIPSMEFTLGAAEIINGWIDGGINGNGGIFQGIPIRLQSCGIDVFQGYLNLAASDTDIQCDIIKVPLVNLFLADDINSKIDSFRFEYLADPSVNIINASDFIPVPYLNQKKVNPAEVIISFITIYALSKETYEAVCNLSNAIGQIIATSTTTGISSGATTANLIADIAYAVLVLVYTVAIIGALITLILKLIDAFYPIIKHKYGMYTRELMRKAAGYLGLDFKSSIFTDSASPYYNEVTIPAKRAYGTNSVPIIPFVAQIDEIYSSDKSYGYFDGTFGDLLRLNMDKFNAAIKVQDLNGVKTLVFERRDFWQDQIALSMPDIRERDGDPHGTNASEIYANYYLTYTPDYTDENTIDEYDGTTASMHLELTNIVDQKYNLLKNNKEVRLPIAKGCRKTQLTDVEEVLSIVIQFYEGLIDTVGGLVNLIIDGINSITSVLSFFGVNVPAIPNIPQASFSSIDNRIGVMITSGNYFEIPKTVIVDPKDGFKLIQNSKLLESPMVLMNNPTDLAELNAGGWPQGFHSIEFGLNEYGDTNQYYIYRQKTIPLCCEDFVSLLNKNVIQTYDGIPAEIMNLNWNQYNQTAVIDYRIKRKYATNLIPKYIYDGR